MKRSYVIAFLCLTVFGGFSPKEQYVKQYLGFSFNPGPNMELVTFALITTRDGIIVKQDYIRKQDFVAIATGKQLSKANPYQINLFEAFDIDECFYEKALAEENVISKKSEKLNCITLDDLWRLRYQTHPQYKVNFHGDNEKVFGGWTKEDKYPSQGQIKLLRQYGISNLIDFFYGENMFILFHDMQDPNWVANYKSA